MSEGVSDVLERIAPAEDEQGFDYFRYHRRRYRFTLEKIDGLAAGRPLRILDVGCYPNHLSSALGHLGHTVFGVSSEHESVTEQNVEILNIEADPFPWPDGYFDLVIFAEVVEHMVHSPVRPLREMLRTTASGGNLFISTPNIASARHRLQLLAGRTIMFPLDAYFEEDGSGCNPYHRHNKEYTLGELEQLIRRTGWSTVDAGYVMAYSDSFAPSAGTDLPSRMLASLKVAAHHIIPGGEDTIFVIGVKPAA